MGSSDSGQDKPQSCAVILATRTPYLVRWGVPAAFRKKMVFFFHIINPLLTSLFAQDGGVLASFSFFVFCFSVEFESVSVYKHVKKT